MLDDGVKIMATKAKKKVVQDDNIESNRLESEVALESLRQAETKPEPSPTQSDIKRVPPAEFPLETAAVLIAVAWFMICIVVVLAA